MATKKIVAEMFRDRLGDFFRLDGAPTQRELAEAAGVHFVHLNRLLHGKFIPGIDLAEDICRAAGASFEAFISDDFDVSSLIPWHPKRKSRKSA